MKNKISCVLIFLLSTLSMNFAAESRIERVRFYSEALSVFKVINIYLPEGYDESTERYPAIYLFHGSADAWEEDGRIKFWTDMWFNAGKIGKMIIVMPGLRWAGAKDPYLGPPVNMLAPDLVHDRIGLGTGRFEDYVIQDLIPYIDENFRTLPYRSQRGLDGFAMGGYGSVMLAVKHPELFGSVGSYDALQMWLDFNDPRVPGEYDDRLLTSDVFVNASIWNPYFGFPRNWEYAEQYNTANIIKEADPAHLEMLHTIQFLIHSASERYYGWHDENQHIVKLLEERGVKNIFEDIAWDDYASHSWHEARKHIRITLPLHWHRFQNPVAEFPLIFIEPTSGYDMYGEAKVKWSHSKKRENITTRLDYSRDAGNTWQTLTIITSDDMSYSWDTQEVPDGTRYLLRVFVLGNSLFSVSEMEDLLTINNPGNAIPDVELLSPKTTDFVSEDWEIRWFADDADSDILACSMKYSSNNGITWQTLFSDLQGSNEFLWDTKLVANSPNYHLLFRCTDGMVEVTDTTGAFEIFNQREAISQSDIAHISGVGGVVAAHVVDPAQLTNNIYRITFNDTVFGDKVYNVLNVDTDVIVVENATELDGISEGPLFDGIRLVIKDFEKSEVDIENTGWGNGSTSWNFSIFTPTLNVSGEIITGFPYPADYKITLFDQVVDTSVALFGVPAVPMTFKIWNLTEDRKAKVLFSEIDSDQSISLSEGIFILEKDKKGELQITWQVLFTKDKHDISPVPPQSGDEFIFRTFKPITGTDIYEFRGRFATSVSDNFDTLPRELILYPNYPNPFNPTTTISYYVPKMMKVRIAIYNVLGQEVKRLIDNTQTAGLKKVVWDGKTNQGISVNSGVYFYRILAGKTRKTGKVLLLR